MDQIVSRSSDSLVGIGLYTLAEAGRLVQVAPAKIGRWLRGHEAHGQRYEPLWRSQVDLGEDGLFLGFRDLQEVRVAAAFIAAGLSPQRVRQAIGLARGLLGEERPLSTKRFRTDGRSVFLQVVEEDGQTRLIDLFERQFALRSTTSLWVERMMDLVICGNYETTWSVSILRNAGMIKFIIVKYVFR